MFEGSSCPKGAETAVLSICHRFRSDQMTGQIHQGVLLVEIDPTWEQLPLCAKATCEEMYWMVQKPWVMLGDQIFTRP